MIILGRAMSAFPRASICRLPPDRVPAELIFPLPQNGENGKGPFQLFLQRRPPETPEVTAPNSRFSTTGSKRSEDFFRLRDLDDSLGHDFLRPPFSCFHIIEHPGLLLPFQVRGCNPENHIQQGRSSPPRWPR